MKKQVIKDKIAAGATILDVRTGEEYAEGFFPGAINMPVNALPKKIRELGPKDTPIIVYCASGGRSAMAAAMLKAQGFADVTDAGGIGEMPS
jgi:phage shock protein E